MRVLWRLTTRSFINGQPGTTPGNVKLPLPPRQSRGNSQCISIDLAQFCSGIRPRNVAPVIETIAALRPEKNLSRLIRVFASVLWGCAARLAIVGDGPGRAPFVFLAAKLGVTELVIFARYRDDVATPYSGFDLSALTFDTKQMALSRRWPAGCPSFRPTLVMYERCCLLRTPHTSVRAATPYSRPAVAIYDQT